MHKHRKTRQRPMFRRCPKVLLYTLGRCHGDFRYSCICNISRINISVDKGGTFDAGIDNGGVCVVGEG